MVNLGLAGVGRIGAFHAETLHRLPDVALVVADADAERARAVAARLGVDWAPDVGALFAAGLDGVVIATPTASHADLITQAVARGLPVFCEKPVAADAGQTAEISELVETRGGRVQIGFQRRFDAGYQAARAEVAAGRLGRLHTLRATTMDPSPPPAAYIATSGGIFQDCSVHDFDIVRWVTGREVVEVFATGSANGESFFRESGDADTAAAVLRMDDDALVLLSAGRYNAAGYDVRLELMGSEDSIAVGFDDHLPMRSVEPGVTWPAQRGYSGFMERFQAAYATELQVFADFAAGRVETSPCTVADALEAFSIAEACDLSRRDGRPVKVSEVRR